MLTIVAKSRSPWSRPSRRDLKARGSLPWPIAHVVNVCVSLPSVASLGEQQPEPDPQRIIRPWMRWFGGIPVGCIAAIILTLVIAFLLNEDPIMPSVPTDHGTTSRGP